VLGAEVWYDLGAGRTLGAVNREETIPWRLFAVRLGSGVGHCRPISTAMAPLNVHTCRL
jgi:hypothetical protein